MKKPYYPTIRELISLCYFIFENKNISLEVKKFFYEGQESGEFIYFKSESSNKVLSICTEEAVDTDGNLIPNFIIGPISVTIQKIAK